MFSQHQVSHLTLGLVCGPVTDPLWAMIWVYRPITSNYNPCAVGKKIFRISGVALRMLIVTGVAPSSLTRVADIALPMESRFCYGLPSCAAFLTPIFYFKPRFDNKGLELGHEPHFNRAQDIRTM